MDAKIKAALLGDAATAAECTAAGIAIPCPFCGGEAEARTGYDSEYAICTQCGARTATTVGDYYDEGFMDGTYALAHWNRRAPVQSKDNPPLTLDELREMDGEPIWYANKKGAEWCILRVVNGVYFAQSGGSNNCAADADTYGKAWLAYRRKPEGSEER